MEEMNNNKKKKKQKETVKKEKLLNKNKILLFEKSNIIAKTRVSVIKGNILYKHTLEIRRHELNFKFWENARYIFKPIFINI